MKVLLGTYLFSYLVFTMVGIADVEQEKWKKLALTK